MGGAPVINPLHVLAVLTGMMTKTFSRIVAYLSWKYNIAACASSGLALHSMIFFPQSIRR